MERMQLDYISSHSSYKSVCLFHVVLDDVRSNENKVWAHR